MGCRSPAPALLSPAVLRAGAGLVGSHPALHASASSRARGPARSQRPSSSPLATKGALRCPAPALSSRGPSTIFSCAQTQVFFFFPNAAGDPPAPGRRRRWLRIPPRDLGSGRHFTPEPAVGTGLVLLEVWGRCLPRALAHRPCGEPFPPSRAEIFGGENLPWPLVLAPSEGTWIRRVIFGQDGWCLLAERQPCPAGIGAQGPCAAPVPRAWGWVLWNHLTGHPSSCLGCAPGPPFPFQGSQPKIPAWGHPGGVGVPDSPRSPLCVVVMPWSQELPEPAGAVPAACSAAVPITTS